MLSTIFYRIKVLRSRVRDEVVVKIPHVRVHLERILAMLDDCEGEAEESAARAGKKSRCRARFGGVYPERWIDLPLPRLVHS